MDQEITLLFAVEAEQLMLSGDIEQAIDLLQKGMAKFPDYSAARVILEKAYSLLEESTADAEESMADADENSILTQDEKVEDFEFTMQKVLEASQDELATENSFEEAESAADNNLVESSAETSDETEINLDFENDDEKLFSDEQVFDIEEFIKQNSLEIEKEKEHIAELGTRFEKEPIKLPSLAHPFKNFTYKPIKTQQAEHLNFIDNMFNLEEDKKIIGLHFLSKKLSSEPYIESISSEESLEAPSISNEDFGIASETIARIYQQQGAKKDAVEAYSQLMISDPSKKDYYQNEIDKILEQ
ncbi:MAG: hypothetical protein GX121_01480 [Ignavibacteria bacterium]|nr:hypothetical protein [Ignavibacteria bacterium]